MSTLTFTSASICNKISKLSIVHSLPPIQTHFPTHCKLHKPFKLYTRSLSFITSLPRLSCASAAFQGLEIKEDIGITEHEDPESEFSEEEEGGGEGRGEGEGEGEEDEVEEEKEPNVSASIDETGKLYVGNLPYTMNSSKLVEIFGEAGNVVSVEVIYDRVTDRSRGFAFVTMGSVEEAKGAVRMLNDSQVGGRTVKVNFPEVPRGGERRVISKKVRSDNKVFIDSQHKVYAGNLSWGLTSQALKDAFADQPGVLSAKVLYERDSGRSRGYGFVSFGTAEAAQSALDAMNGVEVEGRALRLNIAVERTTAATAPQALEAIMKDEESSELVSIIGG